MKWVSYLKFCRKNISICGLNNSREPEGRGGLEVFRARGGGVGFWVGGCCVAQKLSSLKTTQMTSPASDSWALPPGSRSRWGLKNKQFSQAPRGCRGSWLGTYTLSIICGEKSEGREFGVCRWTVAKESGGEGRGSGISPWKESRA